MSFPLGLETMFIVGEPSCAEQDPHSCPGQEKLISNYQGKHDWVTTTASHGILAGKVFYEVTVAASKRGGVCRVGWGSADCGHHLGYDINSFGYGGTAKKSNDAIFETYGEKFGGGDVIGCALNIEADDGLCKISFCKNGKTLGVAFNYIALSHSFPNSPSKTVA